MLPLLTFAAGLATGVFGALVIVTIVGSTRRAQLPPGTRRQIDEAARANRLRVSETRWISPANADFDDEETR